MFLASVSLMVVLSVCCLCCVSLFLILSVCGLLVAVFFFLGHVCSWSLSSMCLSACAVCLLCVLGGLLVVYGWLPFLRCSLGCICVCFLCWLGCVGGCVRVFCSSYFRFSFVLLCVSPGFCVWFWVCGGLFLGGCLVGLGFGVVGFWVWGGGFVLWGGCWWCCFLGVFWVGGGLWAILLLLFLLLFFCLECGFGGCWAWCCCW